MMPWAWWTLMVVFSGTLAVVIVLEVADAWQKWRGGR